ncbi:MAG TPA: alanine racemase [Paenalcaligenes sp.]|nr:alanine racemase [Paenalcaligenes sp.]
MPRPISAIISVPALRHNLAVVTCKLNENYASVGRARPNVWAVIKANAYGHGIDPAVSAFAEADGLAMLDLTEALRCRELGWTKPIMLLEGIFGPEDIELACQYDLTIVLHSFYQIEHLKAAPLSRPLHVMVKLNTGMNRLGFNADDFPVAYQQVCAMVANEELASVGAMTHFARADDDMHVTEDQLRDFIKLVPPDTQQISVCNSAGSLSDDILPFLPPAPEHWVRPGICLYGSSPFTSRSADSIGLRPAQTLQAEIIAVQEVAVGKGIGYGHTYTASSPLRVGVVACGYADGYPRHAPNGTPIYVDGVASSLVGRVSMDMLMVDLTHIPQAAVGSTAVLWGQNGPSVDSVAQAAGTLGYELLCAVAQRVPRTILTTD